MSDKKYLLTENEIISFYGRGYYAGMHGIEPTPYNSEKWFNDREYHERTCHMIDYDNEHAHGYCSECGGILVAALEDYCAHCGAIVK